MDLVRNWFVDNRSPMLISSPFLFSQVQTIIQRIVLGKGQIVSDKTLW